LEIVLAIQFQLSNTHFSDILPSYIYSSRV